MGSLASTSRTNAAMNDGGSAAKFSSAMERAVKKPLQPGRGLMDWIRLCQQNPNMGGGGAKRVTEKDMAEHSEQNNAWMIINGKVYNVAPYMEYHPGGVEQLMRAAGTDGTKLFNEKHPWVNYESMLKSCLVGYFAGSLAKLRPPAKDPLDMSKLTLGVGPSTAVANNFLSLPGEIRYPKSLLDVGINCTWKEDGDSVQVLLDTAWRKLSIEQAIVECLNRCKLRVVFRTVSPPLEIIWSLPLDIDPVSLKASTSLVTPGRLSIFLQKQDAAIVWPEFLHECVVRSMQARKYRTCRVNKVEQVTHDSRLFIIDLPDGDSLPIPVGSHVFVRLPDNERPYTPVTESLSVTPNSVSPTKVHFLIKMYPNGKLTPNLWQLKEGDTIDISDHEGSFCVNKFSEYDHIYLVAAGTGFTPMVRIIQYCLHKSNKKVTLLFFNKTENDILWRDELEKLSTHFERFRVTNVLSDADDSWPGRTGRVSLELLIEFLLPSQASNYVCVCGPGGFVDSCLLYLKELHYGDGNVHIFQG